jgi:methyl coenzyme M reductase gamma subunit
VGCEEKNRLLREYDAATVSFSSAVSELRRRLGTSPKEEFKKLAQISDDARAKSEGARLALEQHISAHGC